MSFQERINEKIQRLQDLNKEMAEIGKKIGALQEQGQALHGAGLELRGAITALAEMKAEEDERLASSKTAQLTLPAGVKPVLPETAPITTAEIKDATEAAVLKKLEDAAPSTTLEVVK